MDFDEQRLPSGIESAIARLRSQIDGLPDEATVTDILVRDIRLAIEDWIRVEDRLPSEDPHCGQADVIFCSPDWGWPIVGMFTNLGGEHEWSAYDQQNDRFETWDGPPPELWMYRPGVPSVRPSEDRS